MTIKEVSEKYNIPIEVLKEYEMWNLCKKSKKSDGEWEYNDDDLEIISIIMTLWNIGFNNDEIKKYMELQLAGDDTESVRLRLLKQKRNVLLDEIHSNEKCIEDIDYLRFKLTE